MATAAVATRMSVEEYLRTPFRPDVDFVDGVIEERNLGEWDHAWLQGYVYALSGAGCVRDGCAEREGADSDQGSAALHRGDAA